MFGYIRPHVPDLRVKENEFYNALYCGVCKDLGKTIGRSARLTLSYDTVFLALLLAHLTGEPFTLKEGRCGLHPFRKKQIVEENAALRHACAASFLLAYHKILDDREDERGLRRLGAKLVTPRARRLSRKAEAVLPRKPELADGFAALSAAEKGGKHSPDEYAALTGAITGELFSCCSDDEVAVDLLREIGMHLGKWVYFADAADDYEEDRRRGRFNPFSEGLDKAALGAAMEAELLPIDHILSAVRVTDRGVDAILRNILHDGLYAVQTRLTADNEVSAKK